MAENGRDAEGRSGCLAARLLGAVARLVLLYPLASIGSQFGQAMQRALRPGAETPYEGAIAGILLALIIGTSLWRSAVAAPGWRGGMADATLILLTALWMMAIAAEMSGRLSPGALLAPWAACLAGAAVVALLIRR